MTTKEAAARYEAEHIQQHADKGYAVFNPNNQPVENLPIIYGFNNGGSGEWRNAQLIAEDGKALGSHICSSEYYMWADLGILEDTRPDRHEDFKKHFPNGYRMEFISLKDVKNHPGLAQAYKLNQEKRIKNEQQG